MKNLFSLLFCAFFASAATAQTFPYTFSVQQSTYTPLQNAISWNNGQVWDDIDDSVPLGFGFQFFGQSTETLFHFGEITAYNVFGLPSMQTPLIISYGADLIDRGFDTGNSLSPISFKTEGTPGSRIFKMEWANAGFWGNDAGDFVNTQLWLYEGSNDVEIHFGPVQSTSPDNFDFGGPLIGFMSNYDFSTDVFQDLWYLVGPVDNPQIEYVSSDKGADEIEETLDSAPTDGLVYRFSTSSVSTSAPGLQQNIRVYPSLVQDAFSIATEENPMQTRYALLDALGKTIRNGEVNNTLQRVEMSGLPAGMYYVHVFSPQGSLITQKIRKL